MTSRAVARTTAIRRFCLGLVNVTGIALFAINNGFADKPYTPKREGVQGLFMYFMRTITVTILCP